MKPSWVWMLFRSVTGGDEIVTPANQLPVIDAPFVFEHLVDQNGAGAVLTFTFTKRLSLVWVRSVGGISRASPDAAQLPTATKGIYCADDEPNPITFEGAASNVLKVFAPSGAVVSVWGYGSKS